MNQQPKSSRPSGRFCPGASLRRAVAALCALAILAAAQGRVGRAASGQLELVVLDRQTGKPHQSTSIVAVDTRSAEQLVEEGRRRLLWSEDEGNGQELLEGEVDQEATEDDNHEDS